jgi:outer membrane receptor for ferrienterochelin and colicins
LGATQQLELYGGVNNIFDEDVDTLLGSSVGPYFFAGIRYNF